MFSESSVAGFATDVALCVLYALEWIDPRERVGGWNYSFLGWQLLIIPWTTSTVISQSTLFASLPQVNSWHWQEWMERCIYGEYLG